MSRVPRNEQGRIGVKAVRNRRVRFDALGVSDKRVLQDGGGMVIRPRVPSLTESVHRDAWGPDGRGSN